MLADVNLITPVRESATANGAKRRREDRLKVQKVLPRRQNEDLANEDQQGQNKGAGLNAYA